MCEQQGREAEAGHTQLNEIEPWHCSGKPSHTCFSFPLVISGNENWNRCYIFWGLEGLYIFLSYNMLVIKCVSLSTKRQDLSVPERIKKKILKSIPLKIDLFFPSSSWESLPRCSLPTCLLTFSSTVLFTFPHTDFALHWGLGWQSGIIISAYFKETEGFLRKVESI